MWGCLGIKQQMLVHFNLSQVFNVSTLSTAGLSSFPPQAEGSVCFGWQRGQCRDQGGQKWQVPWHGHRGVRTASGSRAGSLYPWQREKSVQGNVGSSVLLVLW